jgi:hypothetical protein
MLCGLPASSDTRGRPIDRIARLSTMSLTRVKTETFSLWGSHKKKEYQKNNYSPAQVTLLPNPPYFLPYGWKGRPIRDECRFWKTWVIRAPSSSLELEPPGFQGRASIRSRRYTLRVTPRHSVASCKCRRSPHKLA